MACPESLSYFRPEAGLGPRPSVSWSSVPPGLRDSLWAPLGGFCPGLSIAELGAHPLYFFPLVLYAVAPDSVTRRNDNSG